MPETREIEEAYDRARALIGDGRAGLAEALKLLQALLPNVVHARSRGTINQQIWECERALGSRNAFFSQSGQDAWLEACVFKGKRGGVFAEIGGHDGITGSNCLWFELMRGWSGLLAEPAPALHAQAERIRRCPCLRVAVAAAAGEAEFLDVQAGLTQMGGLVASYDPETRARVEADPRHQGTVIKVPTRPLAAVLDDHGLTEIDYVSLDIEGGEMAVLSAFPFENYRIAAWTIENNRGDTAIPELMQSKGYRRVEALGQDDVYLHIAS